MFALDTKRRKQNYNSEIALLTIPNVYSIEGLTELFCCSKGNNSTNLENVSIRGSSLVTKAEKLSQTFDIITIDVAMSLYLLIPNVLTNNIYFECLSANYPT